MGRKAKVAIVAVIVLLVGGAVAAYAWDASKKDQIAEGVRVGGIDLGGRTTEQARAMLHRELVRPLDKPVTVKFEGTRYVLSPEQLDMRADIDGMVDDALAASREGSLPSRVIRYATGGEVNRTISPRTSYSTDALDEFVDKVAAEVNRDPVDATIEPTPTSLNAVPGEDGVTLRADQLRSDMEAAVQSPDDRTVEAEVDRVPPEVTTDELASKYPTYVTVDRAGFALRLWKDLKLVKTYPIAVGQAGLETPAGLYTIEDKQVDPVWNVPNSDWAGDLAGESIPPGPENPLKARWIGITAGAGIHGTDDLASLGTAASHGCIRMAVPDVIELYDQVPYGTSVYIG